MQLYHFWSDAASQRVHLALGAKGILAADAQAIALAYDDDERFFELGVARTVPVLVLDSGTVLTDSVAILRRIDELVPGEPQLAGSVVASGAWQALLGWRSSVDAVLARLYAPARLAYRDLADDLQARAAYSAEMQHTFGLSVESLANDRYDGYGQLDRLTNLRGLARDLAKRRFYHGTLSIGDCLLAADLAPLQVLDGISLPIDLMYYVRRVFEACGVDLEAGLAAT